MYVISYAHSFDNNFCHGTLSSAKGITKTSWSFDAGEERQTIDAVIPTTTFQQLWLMLKNSRYIASCVTQDPDSLINPITHHLISATFDIKGKQGSILSAIPTHSDNPEFKKWMTMLNIPLEGPKGSKVINSKTL